MYEHKRANPDHAIQAGLAHRFSPYAFADRDVADDDLRSLLEAARWAPSSYNEQPWSYIVATRADREGFQRLLSCLVDGNQAWAKAVPVLALGCASSEFRPQRPAQCRRDPRPGPGQRQSRGLEATARVLVVHQMIGILPDRAREVYQIPEGVQAKTGLAIGYAGDPSGLAAPYRDRDLAPRSRKPLREFVFGGRWGMAAEVVSREK